MIISVVEKRFGPKTINKPFPRFTYDEAIARFGSDKPDIRFGLELTDCGDLPCGTRSLRCSVTALDNGGQVKAIRYPGGAKLPRSGMDELGERAREFGAKRLGVLPD